MNAISTEKKNNLENFNYLRLLLSFYYSINMVSKLKLNVTENYKNNIVAYCTVILYEKFRFCKNNLSTAKV